MPIRINLKEVFTSDSQDIVINKVNFNFNKLLELGIGDDGPQGTTGPQGPAGPTGLTGADGTPGNIWYVDTVADPNTLTLPDKNEGDFYLDTDTFTVWRYNGTIWTQLVELSQVIDDYLSTTTSVFTRGFGNGTPDNNFIVFNNRADRLTDANDILFLNNFNEVDLNTSYPGFSVNANDFFNSLLSISVDRTNVGNYRQHIELGVLYGDGAGTPLGHTSINESFKIKYERTDTSIHSPVIDYYNTATLSLDLPETLLTGRATNGLFKITTPKFFTGVDTRNEIYLGSKFGFDEIIGISEGTLADGILFYNPADLVYINLGIAADFVIPNFPTNTGYIDNSAGNNYFMIDSPTSDVSALYLNDTIYQDGGNIIQIGTTPARIVTSINAGYNSPISYLGHMGIAVSGNNIYTISGYPVCDDSASPYTQAGYLNRFNIENPNTPISDLSIAALGYTQSYNGFTYDITTNLIGPGASDITVIGENIYIVNSQPLNYGYTELPVVYDSVIFDRVNLQVLKIDAGTGVSRYTYFDSPEIYNAYRIEARGNKLIIASNDLYNGTAGITSLSDGVISVVNADPDNLAIEAWQTNTKDVPTSNFGSTQRSAYLDLAIVDDFAVTLTWEQEVVSVWPPLNDPWIEVKVDVFDLSDIQSTTATPSISWLGRSQNPFIQVQVNPLDASYADTFKKGAICANGKYFYAGYSNEIKVFQFNEKFDPSTYTEVNSFTFADITPGSASGIYDIEQLGNSLYVLAHNDGDPFVYKLDISQVDTGTIEQIWSTQLTYPSTQLVVIGKHIYAANHSSDSNVLDIPALTVIDFDGLYTGGAHIESLRADSLHVSQNLKVGESIHIDGDVEIGGDVKILGNIDRLQTRDTLTFTDFETPSTSFLQTATIESSLGINFNSIMDQFGNSQASTKYASLDLAGLTIYDTLKFTDANYYIRSADNDVIIQGNNQGVKLYTIMECEGFIFASSTAATYYATYDTGTGQLTWNTSVVTNAALSYDIQIIATPVVGTGTDILILIDRPIGGSILVSRASVYNTATAIIPAGYPWQIQVIVPSLPSGAQVNATVYKIGKQNL